VLGFAGSLLAREALTRSMFDEEFRLGMYKEDLNQQLDGLNDELYTMTEGAPDGLFLSPPPSSHTLTLALIP